MKPIRSAAMAVLVLLALSCGGGTEGPEAVVEGAAAVPTGADTAKVRELSQARLDAIAEGDVEGYLANYQDEAVWMPPQSEEIVGKPAARQQLEGVFAEEEIGISVASDEQVAMSGGWIADRGSYVISRKPKSGGEPTQSIGSYLTLWQRQSDGSWKIFWDIWNSDRPEGNESQKGGGS